MNTTVTIEMPSVKTCAVTNCAYNTERSCHAKAITVGDGQNPGCDTFFDSQKHNHETRRVAGVGACKVTSCKFNDDYECGANGITVGHNSGKINCLTYSARA